MKVKAVRVDRNVMTEWTYNTVTLSCDFSFIVQPNYFADIWTTNSVGYLQKVGAV